VKLTPLDRKLTHQLRDIVKILKCLLILVEDGQTYLTGLTGFKGKLFGILQSRMGSQEECWIPHGQKRNSASKQRHNLRKIIEWHKKVLVYNDGSNK